MGLFGDKDGIAGTALGASGAFDKNKKTDKAAAFGAAMGASLGSGKKWTLEDSIKLGAAINALDSAKDKSSSNDSYSDYASFSTISNGSDKNIQPKARSTEQNNTKKTVETVKNSKMDLSLEELYELNRINKEKDRKLFFVISGVFALLFLVLFITYRSAIKVYDNAERLISQEKYSEAIKELEQLGNSDFKDARSLVKLCEAHLQYDSGDAVKAYKTIRGVVFFHQTSEQLDKIFGFREMLKKEYDSYIIVMDDDVPTESIGKTGKGLPYIGMSESLLNRTALGEATEIEKCPDFDSLEPDHRYKKYTWLVDGKEVFYAAVSYWDAKKTQEVSGYVSYVRDNGLYRIRHKINLNEDGSPYVGMQIKEWEMSGWKSGGTDYEMFGEAARKYHYDEGDYTYTVWLNERNQILKVDAEKRAERLNTGKSSTRSTQTSKYEPSVEGFFDPEDFYDWYWDDFFDYEDAEGYYYEHGGE